MDANTEYEYLVGGGRGRGRQSSGSAVTAHLYRNLRAWVRGEQAGDFNARAGSELAPVDSNHHTQIQSLVSCRWTRGQL